MKFQTPDSWSFVHFFGSFTLVKFLIFCGVVVAWKAAVLALICGLAWEFFCDEICGKDFEIKLFDSRGFDCSDLIFDALGCGLALLI